MNHGIGLMTIAPLLIAAGCGAEGKRSAAIRRSASQAPPTHVRIDPNSPAGARRLIDQNGNPARLVGLNRMALEWPCVNGEDLPAPNEDPKRPASLFYGPNPYDADGDLGMQVMLEWLQHDTRAVRVPLNQDCWQGANGFPVHHTADQYRQAVHDYVDWLNGYGITVILSMHLTDGFPISCVKEQNHVPHNEALCLKWMPLDDDLGSGNTRRFWTEVASQFAESWKDGAINGPAVIFDIFNEPWPEKLGAADPWACWRDGHERCPIPPGVPDADKDKYRAFGMQDLVDTIRKTGAQNLLLAQGTNAGTDMSQWLQYQLQDKNPDGTNVVGASNIAASWHVYGPANPDAFCSSIECWNAVVKPLAAQVPVLVGELGEDGRPDVNLGCGGDWVVTRSPDAPMGLLNWLDSPDIAAQLSYFPWVYNEFRGADVPENPNYGQKCLFMVGSYYAHGDNTSNGWSKAVRDYYLRARP